MVVSSARLQIAWLVVLTCLFAGTLERVRDAITSGRHVLPALSLACGAVLSSSLVRGYPRAQKQGSALWFASLALVPLVEGTATWVLTALVAVLVMGGLERFVAASRLPAELALRAPDRAR